MVAFPTSVRTLSVCAFALLLCRPAEARPAAAAPPLPAPSGTVVRVSTEPQLQAAISGIGSNTTVLIEPGTYVLTRSLYINRSVTNIAVRGATDNRDDVVLVGRGMTNADYANVPFGIWTGGGVNGITIANLTIRELYFHPIIFNAGTQSPHVYNVHLVNAGEQFVKSNPDDAGAGANNGSLEYSLLEFETTARDDYPKGIDVQGADNWVIRHNLFRNIIGPNGIMAGPGVLAWRGTRNTLTEGNTFINCSRGIMYGAAENAGLDHSGGIIRNNFFYRAPNVPGDVGIHVADSPGTQVLNNTVITSGTYGYPIEYRFPDASGLVIANNLLDGIIRQRDGASGTLTSNETNANAAMFVNAAAGDLHLRSTATAAINQGTAVAGVTDDWDGQPRPQAAAFDIGADEYGSANGSFDISGRVTTPAGASLPGIPVTLSGGQTRTTFTNASGTYAFTGVAGGADYLVTPSTTAYVFSPDRLSFGALGAPQQNASFTAVRDPSDIAPSPDGTLVPPADHVVDGSGSVWSIGANQEILRDGTLAAGGYGSKILWTGGTIYVLGTDINWWQSLGSGWRNVGPAQPSMPTPSPDGTLLPPAPQIVDTAGALWSLGADAKVLRDGVHAAGGLGSKILWRQSTIYVFGSDDNWWRWSGQTWANIGPTQPGTTSSPEGTTVPPAPRIVDAQGAVWTLGGGQMILRNGIHAAFGYGSQILWVNGTIYVLGSDLNWWRWIGSAWANIGPVRPESISVSPDGATAPPAARIVDLQGAIWTLGPNQTILRNGQHAASGYGSQIRWRSGLIYVLGSDFNWWQWTGSGWSSAQIP